MLENNDSLNSKISKFDCQKVITKKLGTENFTILNFQQLPFAEKNGYLGEHSSLNVTIEHKRMEESFTFFVKSWPEVPSQRNFLSEINGFFKEQRFFTKYYPELKKHSIDILDDAVPACYFTNEEVIILEDMKAKGYETLKSRDPMKIECVKAALVAISKLHASGLILEETKSFKLDNDFKDELKESFYAGTDSTDRAMGSSKHGIEALIDLTHQD
ncbi:EcKinase domain containing protein, partial [Asbolus verrucosus]